MTTEIQHTYWQQVGDQRAPDHPVCQFFSEQRWSFVDQFISLQPNSTILDVGCGLGMADRHLVMQGHSVIGGDFSLNQLTANRLETVQKVVFSGDRLPFADNQFHTTMCWEVLHHLPDPQIAVQEMVRVSREWVLIFEPNTWNPAQFLYSWLIPAERGTLNLRSHIVTETLQSTGCDIIYFGRTGCIFPHKTPVFALPYLRLLPFRFPLLGISRLWIARKI